MRDLKAACIVTLCVLGFFALVGGAYVALNPEVITAFLGPMAQ